ncbi:MAG: 4-hydroxy-tetrahydrodipicolinate reductase [Candidatus Hydrogenedentota bacterium]|nr:MAG: 4-hydroxy-tetrahydrodipicolinate reductase [Candidatus Hydrogenedentota bacterium]
MSDSKIHFGIVGAYGRMGQAIARLSLEEDDLELSAAFEHAAHLGMGKPFSIGARQMDFALEELNDSTIKNLAKYPEKVVVDFSLPAALTNTVKVCEQANVPLVIGTTGYSEDQYKHILEASKSIPILLASNMSLGVNLLFALVRQAAASLRGKGFDAEIMEVHHKHKKDAPSGTAKSLEREIMETGFAKKPIYGREGEVGERTAEEIGVMALRGGDVVGDHTVYFFGEGERLELKHQAHSRDTFARGALAAVRFLAGKDPKLYSMADVLNL